MRKQSQLADLILSSGLIKDGSSKKQADKGEQVPKSGVQSSASPASNAAAPAAQTTVALYQFGPGRTVRKSPSSGPLSRALSVETEPPATRKDTLSARSAQTIWQTQADASSHTIEALDGRGHSIAVAQAAHGQQAQYHVHTLAWDEQTGAGLPGLSAGRPGAIVGSSEHYTLLPVPTQAATRPRSSRPGSARAQAPPERWADHAPASNHNTRSETAETVWSTEEVEYAATSAQRGFAAHVTAPGIQIQDGDIIISDDSSDTVGSEETADPPSATVPLSPLSHRYSSPQQRDELQRQQRNAQQLLLTAAGNTNNARSSLRVSLSASEVPVSSSTTTSPTKTHTPAGQASTGHKAAQLGDADRAHASPAQGGAARRSRPASRDGASAAAADAAVRAEAGVAGPAGVLAGGDSTLASAQASVVAAAVAVAEAQLKKQVSELQARVQALQEELTASQRQAAQARAHTHELQEALAGKERAAQKSFKAMKAAESAQERAETGRRAAEKRAATAENEVLQLRGALAQRDAEHTKAQQALQAALDSAQAAHRSQLSALEATIASLRDDLAGAQTRRQNESESDKKTLQDALEKARQDVARRTQTILTLSAENESLKRANTDLETAQKRLTSDLDASEQAYASLEATITQLRQQLAADKTVVTSNQGSEITDKRPQTAHGEKSSSSGVARNRQRRNSVDSVSGRVSSETASHNHASQREQHSYRGHQAARASHTGVTQADGMSAHAQLQIEIARCRQDYAERLQSVEEAVDKAESVARDATNNCQQLFSLLVERTAALLAGRLSVMPQAGDAADSARTVFTKPSAVVDSEAPGQLQRSLSQKRSSVASGPNDRSAVLHALTEQLSAENASLLAEIAKFHAGKHPLQRRHSVTLPSSTTHTSSHTTNNPTNPAPANQAPTTNNTSTTTTTGTSTNGSQPTNGFYGRDGSFHPFLTIKQRSVTSDAASVTGGSESGRSVGPGAGAGVGVGVGVGQKQQQCVGSAAKSALAAAVKEVLLCSRQQLLHSVMTGQGWGGQERGDEGAGGGRGSLQAAAMATQVSSKAESAVSAAESLISLRANHVVLQSEVVQLTSQLLAASKARDEHQTQLVSTRAALASTQTELTTANRRVAELEHQIKRSWTSSVSGVSCSGSHHSISVEESDERVRAARDEAQRHRNAAAAASRDKADLERQIEDKQLALRRVEQQLREERYETHKQEESVKRLRALLTHARTLLRNAGVPFMEDYDTSGSAAGNGSHTFSGSGESEMCEGGGKAGSRADSSSGEPGTLFKAVDAREKEKEAARARAEALDWQAKAQAALKEVKMLRAQITKRETEHKQAVDAATAAAAHELTLVRSELEAVTAVRKQLTAKLAERDADLLSSNHTARELAAHVERLQLNADYLKQRANQLKNQRPKLSLVQTLRMSVRPSAAVAAAE